MTAEDLEELRRRLQGRTARCAYYGRPVGKSNESYNGCRGQATCTCEQPSDASLPFFEYQGEGSKDAERKCTCGFFDVAHYPTWEVRYTVSVAGAPDEERYCRVPAETAADAPIAAEPYIRHLRPQSAAGVAQTYSTNGRREAFIAFGAVKMVSEVQARFKGHTFTARGAADHDTYYCGCHSWN